MNDSSICPYDTSISIGLEPRPGKGMRYVDVALAQGTVPYSILFDHVRRGGKSRDDAMKVLRQRAPEACQEWLNHVEKWGLWTSLLLCHVRAASTKTQTSSFLNQPLHGSTRRRRGTTCSAQSVRELHWHPELVQTNQSATRTPSRRRPKDREKPVQLLPSQFSFCTFSLKSRGIKWRYRITKN